MSGVVVMGAILLATMVGCTDGKGDLPDVVPVTGTVTLDEKLLSGVNVTFMPAGSTKGGGCYGVTDAEGQFELSTNDGRKGAVPGEYRVVCSKWVMPDGSDFVAEPGGPSPLESDAREFLPPRYAEESETELKATVPAGGGTIPLELKGPIAPTG